MVLSVGNLSGFGGGTVYFNPVTNTYNSGTGATESIPANCSQVVIELWGGGAGTGNGGGSFSAGGGSGGGYAKITRQVLPGEYGTNLTYTVGLPGLGTASGNGFNGTATTVTGTVGGSSISVTCPGGNTNSAQTGVAASTLPTGGDVNTSSAAASNGAPTGGGVQGGNGSASPNGGAGGIGGSTSITTPPGFPGGGAGGVDTGSGGDGAGGRIRFSYT